LGRCWKTPRIRRRSSGVVRSMSVFEGGKRDLVAET
jgi:hypothetical protein